MEIGALFPEYIVGFRAKGYYVALDDRFTEARLRSVVIAQNERL